MKSALKYQQVPMKKEISFTLHGRFIVSWNIRKNIIPTIDRILERRADIEAKRIHMICPTIKSVKKLTADAQSK